MKDSTVVKTFNQNHEVGSVVEFKINDNSKTEKVETRSKAFLGRGNKARILIKGKKGSFSLYRIISDDIPTTEFSNPNKENESKKRGRPRIERYESTRKDYYRFKGYVMNQIKKNGNVIVNKRTINSLFSGIKTDWGKIKPIDQFKIFIDKYKLSVKDEDNLFKIEKKAA